MAVDITRHGYAIGVGAVDQLIASADGKAGRVGMKAWGIWYRLGLTLAGLGMQTGMIPFGGARMGENISVPAVTLLTQTLVRQGTSLLPGGVASYAGTAREFVARRAVIPAGTENIPVG